MTLTIIISLIVCLVIYLLFTPIEVYINTTEQVYLIKQGGLLRMNAEWHEDEIIRIRLRILFIPFIVYPLNHWKSSKKKKEPLTKKKSGKKYSMKIKKFYNLFKTFKVRQLSIDLDTGDVISNAKLYPVFSFLDFHYGGFRINFIGRNSVLLHLSNSPIRMIRSII